MCSNVGIEVSLLFSLDHSIAADSSSSPLAPTAKCLIAIRKGFIRRRRRIRIVHVQVDIPCRTASRIRRAGIDAPRRLDQRRRGWDLPREVLLPLFLLNFEGKTRTEDTLEYPVNTPVNYASMCTYGW